jgi:hypothetical protein
MSATRVIDQNHEIVRGDLMPAARKLASGAGRSGRSHSA